jgi:hypothetical protein
MVRQVAAKEDKEVGRALLRNEEKHIKRMRERAIVSPSEQEFHRKVAVECFNKTWDFLKKKDNTRNDEQLMLNLAHSSRYHWSFVGKAGNFAIGDWQISRVYSALSQPDLAIHFAKTSLETCLNNDLRHSRFRV